MGAQTEEQETLIARAHAKLITAFISKVLSKVMSKYIHPELVYPVVVGGVTLARCAERTASAKTLIKKLKLNDIDIKFVITKDLKTIEDGGVVDFVDKQRRKFLKECLEHPSIKAIMDKLLKDFGLRATFEMKTKYANAPPQGEILPATIAKLYVMRVLSVEVSYSDATTNKELEKMAFLDTAIFSNVTNTKYHYYPDVFEPGHYKSNLVLPYVMHRGVAYSTCGWAYIDTVEMLGTYAATIADKQAISKPSDFKFRMKGFVKYLAKFIVMYIMINNTKEDSTQMRVLKRTFQRSSGLLKKVLQDIDEGDLIHEAYAKYAWFYKHILDKHTNLKELRAAFTKSNLHTYKNASAKLRRRQQQRDKKRQ